jgi:hypothetical protein
MAFQKKTLTDPVDEAGQLGIEAAEGLEFDSLDVSKIVVEVLPEEAAKIPHPFDGYPVKKIKIPMKETDRKTGKQVLVPKEFSITDWVLHNSIADPIHQDPSNRNRKTYHSRSVPDALGGNSSPNILVQFSVPVKTANGVFYGALVPDPYVRSQLIFTTEKAKKGASGRVMVDKRYLLLDPNQKGRLMKCYQQLLRPQQEMERAADFISDVSKEEPSAIRDIEYGATEI